MVVDDNASVRTVLREMLESFSFDVTTAESGEKALALLQSSIAANSDLIDSSTQVNVAPYRLILIDWRMPGIDGRETCRQVREMKELPPPPKLVMATCLWS